jgi:integrase
MVKRGGLWHFRRRVPQRLQPLLGTSIYRSLGTACKKEATRRSACLFLRSEGLFAQMDEYDQPPTDGEILAAVRQWLEVNLGWQRAFKSLHKMPSGEFYRNREAIAESMATPVDDPDDLSSIDDLIIDQASAILDTAGYNSQIEGEDILRKVHKTLIDEVQRRVDERFNQLFQTEKLDVTSSEKGSIELAPPVMPPNLSTFFDDYALAMTDGEKWTGHTKAQNLGTLNLMIRLIGDKAVGSITRNDAKLLRAGLERVPSNFGKPKWHFKVPIDDVLKERAGPGTLSVSTLDRHWTTIAAFFKWLNRQDDITPLDIDRTLGGFFWSKDAPKSKRRIRWEAEALNKLFLSPIWTGYQPKPRKDYWRWEPGKTVQRDHYFWLPLLAIFTGARLEELCQLRREDIGIDDGITTIRITDEHPEQRLKNEPSKRKVPVHRDLIKIGFLRYLDTTHGEWLFPSMVRGGREKKLGHHYTKVFTQYRRKVEVYQNLMDFHSFRHTAITGLIRSKADRPAISQIVGHSTSELKEAALAAGKTWEEQSLPSEQTMLYFGGFSPQALKSAIDELSYPELNLGHLYG